MIKFNIIVNKPANKTSLRKCPPAIIRIKPKRIPETRLKQRNKTFLVIRYKITIEKPTEESPDTKEQLDLQALLN